MELTMKNKFDYKGIRSEFPFLSRKVNQKPIIYLEILEILDLLGLFKYVLKKPLLMVQTS